MPDRKYAKPYFNQLLIKNLYNQNSPKSQKSNTKQRIFVCFGQKFKKSKKLINKLYLQFMCKLPFCFTIPTKTAISP